MDYWGGGGKGYVAPPPPLSNYWGGPGPPLPTTMPNKITSPCVYEDPLIHNITFSR